MNTLPLSIANNCVYALQPFYKYLNILLWFSVDSVFVYMNYCYDACSILLNIMRNHFYAHTLFLPILVVFVVFIVLLPRMITMAPLVHSDARRAMQQSFDTLKAEGYWMVHMRYTGITRSQEELCVHWRYAYRSAIVHTGFTEVTTCHS